MSTVPKTLRQSDHPGNEYWNHIMTTAALTLGSLRDNPAAELLQLCDKRQEKAGCGGGGSAESRSLTPAYSENRRSRALTKPNREMVTSRSSSLDSSAEIFFRMEAYLALSRPRLSFQPSTSSSIFSS